MKKLIDIVKKIQPSRLLVTFLVGTILLITTACNSGNEVGARPNNPPVQMGGQNNPHKAGGDDYTQYKSPTAPSVKKVSLRSDFARAIATISETTYDENSSGGLLYPGSGDVKSAKSKDDFVSPGMQKKLMDPTQIPEQTQPIVDRSDPDAKLLEKAGQAFKDASQFLTESVKDIDDR